MRCLVARSRGPVLEELAPPVLRPGEVRIAAATSLVSPGTELHYVDEMIRTDGRLPLGYCSSGVVTEVAGGSAGFAPGDRVIAMGWGYALHAEEICVPYRLCVRLPATVTFDDGVFAGLAATALHAIHRATLDPADRVLVVGAGLVGQLVAQCARRHAALTIVTDLEPARVAAAATSADLAFVSDADTFVARVREATSIAPDVVFLCVTGDATRLVKSCIELVAGSPGPRHRRLVAVGRFTATTSFDVGMGNLDIRYSARCGAGYRDEAYVHGEADVVVPPGEQTVTANLEKCVAMIADGHISPEPLVSRRLPFDAAPSIYDELRRDRTLLGVLLHYGAR